jgi:outer membrane protein OmpA-like peptidoglycan-associated protein
MRRTPSRIITSLAIVLSAIVTVNCSKREPTANAATPPAAAPGAAANAATAVRTACAMLPAAEMSTILGTTVGAEGNEGGSSTTCSYRPSERSMPFVEVQIERGGGSAAMVAMRMMGRLEPGMANPLAGLGDEASAIGPAFMVRTGEDLVRLTLSGVDDDISVAKRIVNMLRPRMGTSAQPTQETKGHEGLAQDSPEARAGQVVGALLGQLARGNQTASREPSAAGSDAHRATTSSAAPADEAFAPAKTPAIRIPLVAGLMLTGAEHEAGRGDYEPMFTVKTVTDASIAIVFSADLPEGDRVVIDRVIRREDLTNAREYRPWYVQGDPSTFPGATALGVSTAVYSDLKTKGKANLTHIFPQKDSLMSLVSALGGAPDAHVRKQATTLERVEPHALGLPVLVNDEPAELPAIHARARLNDETIDFYVLDDPENPLVLLLAGGSRGRIVRIAFPTADVAPLEEKLKKHSRVELHGIYFDFGKATIRPESEPVLRDIASALTHNLDWTLNIEGHTDNIGGEALNLDLSRRRADAVKQALVDRYRISASHLTTAGFGASRPNASNDTMSGRARNRRVELVRQ